jgi:hypothetical protein
MSRYARSLRIRPSTEFISRRLIEGDETREEEEGELKVRVTDW